MVVDGGAVRDRLVGLVPPGTTARFLVDQLHADMPDAEYVAIATAIVRALAEPTGAGP